MGRNGHVWTQTKEVTFVGLLILRAVWHRAHAAHRQQRLVVSKTEHNIWRMSEQVKSKCVTTTVGEKWQQQQTCFNCSGKSQHLYELAESP